MYSYRITCNEVIWSEFVSSDDTTILTQKQSPSEKPYVLYYQTHTSELTMREAYLCIPGRPIQSVSLRLGQCRSS